MLEMKYCPLCSKQLEKKLIDGATRFVCSNPQCNHTRWNNPVPVVAALVKFQDRYIIARNADWPRKIFSVITGYLEANETVEQAVLREVQEELNLTGSITRFLGNHIFREKNQVILAYEVDAHGDIKLNDELVEYKILSQAELINYDFKPLYVTQHIIDNWKRLA